jgi:protein-L-isoaspartate O-methyltransferase
MYLKIWEPFSAKLLKEKLSVGDTFIDVGANIGYFSALAASIVSSEGSVYTFEPIERFFSFFGAIKIVKSKV